SVVSSLNVPMSYDNDGSVVDVTILMLDGGYASTAVGPLEVFHSAGLLWNMLRGEATRPRFRVRIASVDGKPVAGPCALGLTPNCAMDEIDHTDIVVVSASGTDVEER